jgi:DNA adenine methylase
MIRPLLKWVGGKTQCIDVLTEHFPDTCRDYYEPFVGGGSVLLAVLEGGKVKRNVYASDVNEALVYMYIAVQTSPDALVDEIEGIGPVGEQTYYTLRDEFNALDKKTLRASALFMVLNKTCFRGLYREGPRGFNVPFGHYKNPTIVDRTHVHQVSMAIQKVVFRVEPYQEALARAGEEDFVYMDPPYFPVSKTSFTEYSTKEFSGEDFVNACKGLKCTWVMSNSDVPMLREMFPWYVVVPCRRAIHSKDPSSMVNELLMSSEKGRNKN